MTKTYTYDISGETTLLERTDELEEFPTQSIEYTASSSEIKTALAEILYDEYFIFKELAANKLQVQIGLRLLLDDNDDIVEQLAETYDDALYEYFKKEVLNETT